MKVYLVIKEYSDYDAHSFEIMKAFYDEEKARAYADKYDKELTFQEKVEKSCDDYHVSNDIISLYDGAPKFDLERPRIDRNRKHDKEYIKEHEKACHKWTAERNKWHREIDQPFRVELNEKLTALMEAFKKSQVEIHQNSYVARPEDDNWSFSVQAIEIED
jgi:hypothetical protein